MPYARYRPLRRCIHCKGKHDSEDHHLSLGIPTLPDPDPENVSTAAPPTAITPKQEHTNDRYKTLGAPLPNQQLAYHQWQTTTHPPPPSSTKSPSPRSALDNASFTFTRRLPTSSTSNPTSDYKDSSYHPRWEPGPSTTRPVRNSPPPYGRNRKSFKQSASSSNGRKTQTATPSTSSRKQQIMVGTTRTGKRDHSRYDNDDFDDPYDGIPEARHNMET